MESDLLIKETPSIAEALSKNLNLQVFGHALVTERLITQSTLESIWNIEPSNYGDVALRMVRAVAENVLLSPSKLDVFLRLLKDEPPLCFAFKRLSNTCGEWQNKNEFIPFSKSNSFPLPCVYVYLTRCCYWFKDGAHNSAWLSLYLYR